MEKHLPRYDFTGRASRESKIHKMNIALFVKRSTSSARKAKDETDEEFAARIRAYHKRHADESKATYWARLANLMRFDMAKLREISSKWATIEDFEEEQAVKREAALKLKR